MKIFVNFNINRHTIIYFYLTFHSNQILQPTTLVGHSQAALFCPKLIQKITFNDLKTL